MTHDELLAGLDDIVKTMQENKLPLTSKYISALRSVVELHKPRDYKAGNWCIGCNADYEYPCPTIQAIEKELA